MYTYTYDLYVCSLIGCNTRRLPTKIKPKAWLEIIRDLEFLIPYPSYPSPPSWSMDTGNLVYTAIVSVDQRRRTPILLLHDAEGLWHLYI